MKSIKWLLDSSPNLPEGTRSQSLQSNWQWPREKHPMYRSPMKFASLFFYQGCLQWKEWWRIQPTNQWTPLIAKWLMLYHTKYRVRIQTRCCWDGLLLWISTITEEIYRLNPYSLSGCRIVSRWYFHQRRRRFLTVAMLSGTMSKPWSKRTRIGTCLIPQLCRWASPKESTGKRYLPRHAKEQKIAFVMRLHSFHLGFSCRIVDFPEVIKAWYKIRKILGLNTKLV